MLRENTLPGTTINELELARRFGVATTGIREFLNRFQRFGLIEKRPNGGWVLHGFTESFALELFEIREMFELRSAMAFASLPEFFSACGGKLKRCARSISPCSSEIQGRYHDFSDLDSRFHRLINSAARNRFIDGFYDIFTLIFHYHYQWNKRDERQRNEVAIREHLAYIEAMLSRNAASVRRACNAHLASAKTTLIRVHVTAAASSIERRGRRTDGPLLCRFLDAGITRVATRSGGRRPKSARARSRGKLGSG